MLSDEEKKAIEYLKRHILPYYGSKGRIEFMLNDIILNLIEKQSKEIEELKNADLTIVYMDGFYDGRKKIKDKIKSKIEELEKEQEDNRKKLYDAVNNLNFKEIDKISDRISVNMSVRGILQGLLEEDK